MASDVLGSGSVSEKGTENIWCTFVLNTDSFLWKGTSEPGLDR